MGKPKSYKDLRRDVIKSSPRKELYKHPDDSQRRRFIKFVNTLSCPLCSAALEGGVDEELANLYCVRDPKEYHCQYIPTLSYPVKDKMLVPYSGTIYYEILHSVAFKDGSPIVGTTVFKHEYNGTNIERNVVIEHCGSIMFGALGFLIKDFIRKMEMYDVFS